MFSNAVKAIWAAFLLLTSARMMRRTTDGSFHHRFSDSSPTISGKGASTIMNPVDIPFNWTTYQLKGNQQRSSSRYSVTPAAEQEHGSTVGNDQQASRHESKHQPISQQTISDETLARFAEITKPWPNVTTVALLPASFYSGYQNQIVAFTALVMYAAKHNHSQILLTRLRHKDTNGGRFIPHEVLFDVEHWNSFYPAVPRLVTCDPVLHYHLDCSRPYGSRWLIDNPEKNATHPYASGQQHSLVAAYRRYSKGSSRVRNPMELTIRMAMRPHPDLSAIADRMLESVGVKGNNYLTLHTGIELDMQTNPGCRDKEERNLSGIFKMLEQKFAEPPAPIIFMPINRKYLEKEGNGPNKEEPDKTNWLAIENLAALNAAVSHGLWNGTVKVFESGAKALAGSSPYDDFWSMAGAALNFHIATGGSIFVGSEVSNYSVDLLSTRFYRGNLRNYKYLLDGLQEWTPEGTEQSPGFHC